MNMTDMIQEAQEICEKARAFITTEDYMEAAYKLCDLQVLLVRMEYEAGWDPVVRAVNEMIPKMHEGGCVEPRFDNMPNPTPTVTQDPAQTHIDAPEEWGVRKECDVSEELGETGAVAGETGEPTITDMREDDEIPHTSEVTSGSRFTLGGILGRH